MTAKKSSAKKPAAARRKQAAGSGASSKKPAAKKKKAQSAAKTASSANAGRDWFPVVGIGASAGGLEALEELLDHMPADTGMAFVIVNHLHPGHTSLLPELLGRVTKMPVEQASEGMRLARNHVYIVPPGGYMAVRNSTLHMMDGPRHEVPPLPIDFFFRSLAEDQKDFAICIVLSGTGSDGTVGLKAVKGEGGMAMVQEIESARYVGMPSSAIETTLADFVLPPPAMPEQLVAYSKTLSSYRFGPADTAEVPPHFEQPMQKVFVLLRSRTGHDFSSYKPSTMRRRIERRMTVHQLEKPDHYVRLLQENPHEIDILFKELLIGVTSFFRDPEAFQALAERALPELIQSRPEGYTFRVWVPGCGSGEEAYTLAILLRECTRETGGQFDIQVFGTDLDAEAIEVARGGRYPAGIAADVPGNILRRYFVEDNGSYRVRREIRELLVFAPQNVIKDPPFTKIDLLCCRNLLIYLNSDLQKRLFPIYHYTLKPGGLLMLGPSETIGGFGELFTTVDKKWKIYRRRETAVVHGLPEIPAQPVVSGCDSLPPADNPTAPPARLSVQIEKLLLSRFAPAAVIVNERGDIAYLHGRTGMYLEPPAGQPSLNIHAMAREGLQIELASALRQAMVHEDEVLREHVRVKTNGDFACVDLGVSRITEPETMRGLLLVTFRPTPPPPPKKAAGGKRGKSGDPADDGRVQKLERELQYSNESLQTTVEELETSNEELKSTNEELQSTNEELQSSNEELVTSKEEMQSLNEELSTVNSELQSKVDELSRVNDDMQNLLNSTDIATLFLDTDLHIKRYTERAMKVIKLIPSDIGRPVDDLVSDLRYEGLADDAREVLRTLERKEMQVESKEGTWYLLRMMPYRTAGNAVEGIVITFIDISETKKAEATAAAEKRSEALLQSTFDAFQVPALVLDHKLRVSKANRAFCQAFATNLGMTENQLIYDIVGGGWDLPKLRELLEKVIPKSSTIDDFEVSARFPKIGRRAFRLNARRLKRDTGLPGMILLTMVDVTKEK